MIHLPLVSILMTVYNREKYIAEAIESVLASTYQNWELIIVDDNSADGTYEIAKSFEAADSRVRVIRNDKNYGDYPNRNHAASFAKGKYLKYVDHDDYIYPYGLEQLVFYILPNGSDPQARPLQSFHNTYHKFLFVGSLNYEPNYNGLKWFVDKIFKRLDNHYHLDIVGRSPNPKHFEYVNEHPGINLIGEVDDLESVYQKYDVMVVPLLEGSGTRLKILEAMSYGKLVLSTAKGIEGIDAVNNEHYLEFNTLEDFKSILNKLENSEEVKIIRTNGRNLIENSYSWCGIVKKYLSVKKV